MPRWKQESKTFRNRLGISPTYAPWTSKPDFKADGLKLTARVKDVLDVVAAHHMKMLDKSAAEVSADLSTVMVDVSQGLSRKAFSTGCHKCLTTSTCCYSYGAKRVVTPFESLLMQGYPKTLSVPSHIRASELKTLAGEGMHLACVATALWALWVSVDLSEETPLPGDIL